MMLASRRLRAGIVAIALAGLLTACLFMPGKFTSELDVRKDGTFAFRYTGGIYLLPLAMPDAKPTFEATPCYDDDAQEHPCTDEELATQKSDFDTKQAEKAKSDSAASRMMFGGIDPADPKAAEEIAERLRRQKGWNRVDYKGGGLFDVDVALTGRLDRDFAFPTVERFPVINAFVQISARQDGTIRIDAPGFAPASGTMAAGGMMQGAMASGEAGPTPPSPEGTFTIRTDAAILANNTDEGPRAVARGQELTWQVNARTPAAPTALLRPAP